MAGKVVGLFTTPGEGRPMVAHERVTAIAGRGLDGDRYALGTGFYSARPLPGGARELTLIEAEALEEIPATGYQANRCSLPCQFPGQSPADATGCPGYDDDLMTE